jgi:hypothetical protein
MKTSLRRIAEMAAALCLLSGGACAAPGSCGNSSEYKDYTVTRVDIKNPFGFIEPWASRSSSLRKGLKVRAGQKLSISDFNADVEYLGRVLDSEFASSGQKVKLDYATGSLEDCDPVAQTLRVVYPIFTSVVPSLNPPSIEQEGNESQRPSITGPEQVSAAELSV